MKLRHPLLIRLVAALIAGMARVWLATTRLKIVSADGLPHPSDPLLKRNLYVFWHEGILGMIANRGRVQVLISRHADGELIAQACRLLGYGTIRGSSKHGGSRAMFEMIRDADSTAHLIVTPDGPRGPRRRMKAGAVLVASQTGLPIVPIGLGFTSAWRAGSWDRFAVPRPFSTLVGVVGEPIVVPADLRSDEIDGYIELAQQRLAAVTVAAEDWAERLRHSSVALAPSLPRSTTDARHAA